MARTPPAPLVPMYLALVTVPSRPALRLPLGVLTAVVPDLLLAAAYALTWLLPGAFGPEAPGALARLVLLEFFAGQGAAFLGVAAIAPFPRGLRAAIVAALGAVYMLMLWPLTGAIGARWLVWAFWALVLNRLWALAEPALDADLRSSQPLQDEWGRVALIYLGLLVAVIALPVPELGLDQANATAGAAPRFWLRTTEQSIALGTLFYGISAWRRLVRGTA